jgi:hypothetical protein
MVSNKSPELVVDIMVWVLQFQQFSSRDCWAGRALVAVSRNKVKKGARFFIFGNSRNSEIGRAQDFCVKTNKSQ